MASPRSGRLSVTPGSRILHQQTPMTDDPVWRRLRDAGFDEESIKRRDKAALIGYIAKLESEIFDYQHHMGLLILEKKEMANKAEEAKASAEAAELKYRRDQSAHAAALVESRKREENLKKALGVEKECIASLEKALHEMRAESAETKVAAEGRLSESRSVMENTQKKLVEAEEKLRAAESLKAEASRYRNLAERKIHEVEGREDDMRRRIESFKSECDAKESEILQERKSLVERQRLLCQGEERLLEGQLLLNQREEHILTRSQELDAISKDLEASKLNLERQRAILSENKSELDLKTASLLQNEESIVRRESLLNQKEKELLNLQESLSSMQSDEIQKVLDGHESAIKSRKAELEAEMERKRKLVDDETESMRRVRELKEIDLKVQEEQLRDREHDLEKRTKSLTDLEKEVLERLKHVESREEYLASAEKDCRGKTELLLKEKEEINKMKRDLKNSMDLLEDKKKQVDQAQGRLEVMKSETDELSVLEVKLKEELDWVRAQKLVIMAEADTLQSEKSKFEKEWELIDERREELKKEAERIAEERVTAAKFFKDERDSLREEKEAIRNQHRNDVEALRLEREEFMNKMVQDRSEWFSKIQQERADFLLEIEVQKKELENCIDKRREELESSLKEKEKAFEEEKKNELQRIRSLKETVDREFEHVASEMKRLESERMEVNLDWERRSREWADLQQSVEELSLQRQKLEKQREWLHADKEEIQGLIAQLRKLEDARLALDRMAVLEMQQSFAESRQQIISEKGCQQRANASNYEAQLDDGGYHGVDHSISHSLPEERAAFPSPSGTVRFSWIKHCSDLIFRLSYEKSLLNAKNNEGPMASTPGIRSLLLRDKHKGKETKVLDRVGEGSVSESHGGEERTIFEVPTKNKNVANDNIYSAGAQEHNDFIKEQLHQPGRKRRMNEPFEDPAYTSLGRSQSKKIKGLERDDVIDPSELAVDNQCAVGPTSISEAVETHVLEQETEVLVVEKLGSEVTLSDPSGQVDEDQMQNSIFKSIDELFEGGLDSPTDLMQDGKSILEREMEAFDGAPEKSNLDNILVFEEFSQDVLELSLNGSGADKDGGH
ncbi:hypothetical protein MLD38_023918 [Melastoma candidum]|uniref:Uncharacterized protein n=1 Tax=Melastoma candidum TaxID=119954 RepID=A0ACB9NVM4_9MYRT|nr:hypothetical protein MLD38_023918 [Melastoma candidum]